MECLGPTRAFDKVCAGSDGGGEPAILICHRQRQYRYYLIRRYGATGCN
jgi:hypothetical protein